MRKLCFSSYRFCKMKNALQKISLKVLFSVQRQHHKTIWGINVRAEWEKYHVFNGETTKCVGCWSFLKTIDSYRGPPNVLVIILGYFMSSVIVVHYQQGGVTNLSSDNGTFRLSLPFKRIVLLVGGKSAFFKI